jgi:DNA polymerase III psi subunit
MPAPIVFDIEDVHQLYGPKLYRVGSEDMQAQALLDPPVAPRLEATPIQTPVVETPAATSGITWRLKATSPRILFVLQAEEFRNKELTELLKKIVESLKIDTDLVSFGSIGGPISLAELQAMPAPIAVIFDQSLAQGQNPQPVAAGDVFFSHPLADLAQDNTLKRLLWDYLKQVQPKLA